MAQAAPPSTTARPAAHPIPRFGRGLSARRRRNPQPGLADDLAFMTNCFTRAMHGDEDMELCTWPELIDQRRLDALTDTPFCHDDAEPDDEDHGIEDEGQDALEEDGI